MELPDIGSSPEKEKMDPMEVLAYVAQIGRDLEKYALQAQAMIEIANERGIAIDLSHNEALEKFAPLGEYEITLVKLRLKLMNVGVDLLDQGVKITHQDLEARLEKMKKSK